jgi:16S rRNA (guanine(966)-N(2))-methyltransferase RsmD
MQPSKVQIRIIAGNLRGRKISAVVHEDLRPTAQMVREALFSILGNAVPGRPFFDVFAGTGAHGLEAISRGASEAIFIERDAKLATAIDARLKEFEVQKLGQVIRADVYRWAERWVPPIVPVNLFLSPPFADLTERFDAFLGLVKLLADKAPAESCVCIQAEDGFPTEMLPGENWDVRTYGRNVLAIWVRDSDPAAPEKTQTMDAG